MIPLLLPVLIALAGHTAFAGSGGERHNQLLCTIFGMDGKPIRTFPWQMCAFLPDGKVAFGFGDRLVMKGPKGERLWQLPFSLNHQLNVDLSGKRLLTIANDRPVMGGEEFHSDTLYVLGLDGSVLGRYALADHIAEFEARKNHRPRPPAPGCLRALGDDCNPDWLSALDPAVELAMRTDPEFMWRFLRKLLLAPSFAGGTSEYSHVNSIYEIPENAYAAVDPAFRPGGFIVNALVTDLVFILDSKLERILWSRTYSSLGSLLVHDVQVLPNGHLLFYENLAESAADARTSLVEYDLASERKTILANAVDFYAPFSGGVQLLENGNVLYNDPTSGYAGEVDAAGRAVWSLYNHPDPGEPRAFQQAKRYNLDSFLANNSDLASLPPVRSKEELAKMGTPPLKPSALRIERDGANVTAFGTRLLRGNSWKPTTRADLTPQGLGLNLLVWVGKSAVPVQSATDTQIRFTLPVGIPASGSATVRIFFQGILRGLGTIQFPGTS